MSNVGAGGVAVIVVGVMTKHEKQVDPHNTEQLKRCVTATAVAMAESGGESAARCFNYRSPSGRVVCASTAAAAQGPVLSVDRGLWQFNSKAHAEVSDATADAPGPATDQAYRVSNGFRDFGQWSAYSGGLYKSHITDAQAAVKNAVGTDQSTMDKVLNSGAADAVAGVVSPLASAGKLLGALGDAHTWVRVLEVVGGLAAIVVGAFLLNEDLTKQALGSFAGAAGVETAGVAGSAAVKAAAAAV